jgi:hypothetical protein
MIIKFKCYKTTIYFYMYACFENFHQFTKCINARNFEMKWQWKFPILNRLIKPYFWSLKRRRLWAKIRAKILFATTYKQLFLRGLTWNMHESSNHDDKMFTRKRIKFRIFERSYACETNWTWKHSKNELFIRIHNKGQVTLVCGLAQLFLVEVLFLDSQQIIYSHNFKKWNEHILAVFYLE